MITMYIVTTWSRIEGMWEERPSQTLTYRTGKSAERALKELVSEQCTQNTADEWVEWNKPEEEWGEPWTGLKKCARIRRWNDETETTETTWKAMLNEVILPIL